MEAKYSFFFLSLAVFTIAPIANVRAQSRCDQVFTFNRSGEAKLEDPLIKADLLQLQISETRGLTKSQIDELNQQSLNFETQGFADFQSSGRLKELSYQNMQKVLASILKNPVIKASKNGEYNQPNVQIGYCFGRAAYVHLTLLKMGLDKNSIRKVWAVGSFGKSDPWQFHVATAVKGENGKWYALDELFGGDPVEIKAWFNGWQGSSVKGDMRFYVTDAQKFTASLGTYDRLQMGLKFEKEKDWYKGFFKDLMTWFRTGSLESVGLERLIPKNKLLIEVGSPQPRAVEAGSLQLRAGEETFARIEGLVELMNSANVRYQQAESRSSSEAQARQELVNVGNQIDRLIESANFSSFSWKDLVRRAKEVNALYLTSVSGSVMEKAHLNLMNSLYASLPISVSNQAVLENWNSKKSLDHFQQFLILYQAAPQGSSSERAFAQAVKLSSAKAIESYRQESQSFDLKKAIESFTEFDLAFQKAASQSQSEHLYRSLRDVAFEQAINRYKVVIQSKDFQSLEKDLVNFLSLYQKAFTGSKTEGLYLQLKNLAKEGALGKLKSEAQTMSQTNRQKLKANYQYLYRQARSGSTLEAYYSEAVRVLN